MKSAFFPGFSEGFCIFFAYFQLFVLETLEFLSVRGKNVKNYNLFQVLYFNKNNCDEYLAVDNWPNKNLTSYHTTRGALKCENYSVFWGTEWEQHHA